MPRVILALAVAGGVCCALVPKVHAQTVWSGFDFSFEKAPFLDHTLPANQDRITDNVWITRRAGGGGIINAAEETEYLLISPEDTEWATDINNPSDTIAATNWAALEFDPWIDAYGGQGSQQLDTRLTSRNAVVHLITDNIYLDLRFTGWTVDSGSGGGFAYDRALSPDGPDTTGDYNLDGFVNAADYVFWSKTFGHEVPEGTGADGVADGTIDDADYEFWVEHFGETVTLGAGPSTSAVPEPAALPLMTLILILGSFHARDRR